MANRILISTMMTALLAAVAGCQLHPRPNELNGEILPPAPTPELPYHVSGMRLETIAATGYLYSPERTSFDDIALPSADVIPRLRHLITTGTVHPAGPVLFVYHDPTEKLSVPFDLEIGLPLHDVPSTPVDGFRIRTLPAFRCASVIYRGPMKLLPKAYDQLIPEMIAAGWVPSDETRESYLVFDSPDSPSNVVQIEVGIR